MQKVIYQKEIKKYSEQIDQAVVAYIEEGQIETYECFESFSIVAFDWYNIKDLEADPAKIMLYIDREDFFAICENEVAFDVANKLFTEAPSNERAMYLFFKNLFKGDAKNIEEIEDRISDLDDAIIAGTAKDAREDCR